MKRHIKKTIETELLAMLQHPDGGDLGREGNVFAKLDAARILCGLAGIVITETILDRDSVIASSKMNIHWKLAKETILAKTVQRKNQRKAQNRRNHIRKKLRGEMPAGERVALEAELSILMRTEYNARVPDESSKASNSSKSNTKELDPLVHKMMAFVSVGVGAGADVSKKQEQKEPKQDQGSGSVTESELDLYRQEQIAARNAERGLGNGVVLSFAEWIRMRRETEATLEAQRQGE